MAALLVGGDQIQMKMQLPASVGVVLQGMILIPMLAGRLFTEYRLHRVSSDSSHESEALTPSEEEGTA
jgi:ABC-type uncharacterized transport system permease subunit